MIFHEGLSIGQSLFLKGKENHVCIGNGFGNYFAGGFWSSSC